MYENVHKYDPNGTWLMILGVNTDPQFRNHQFASGCIKAGMQQQKGFLLLFMDWKTCANLKDSRKWLEGFSAKV